jgi:hypothetical protein
MRRRVFRIINHTLLVKEAVSKVKNISHKAHKEDEVNNEAFENQSLFTLPSLFLCVKQNLLSLLLIL